MIDAQLPSSDCQSQTLPNASGRVSKPADLAYRACTYRSRYGFRRTVGKLLSYFRRVIASPRSAPPSCVQAKCRTPEIPLALQPGEIVEVKSQAEIDATLDAHGKHRGLAFLAGMRLFCGHRLTVLKRVERIYLEESGQTRTMKHTVLLGGAMCDGLLMGCDRSCFFYWREDWLRRAKSL